MSLAAEAGKLWFSESPELCVINDLKLLCLARSTTGCFLLSLRLLESERLMSLGGVDTEFPSVLRTLLSRLTVAALPSWRQLGPFTIISRRRLRLFSRLGVSDVCLLLKLTELQLLSLLSDVAHDARSLLVSTSLLTLLWRLRFQNGAVSRWGLSTGLSEALLLQRHEFWRLRVM
jgi:hypothetical protein